MPTFDLDAYVAGFSGDLLNFYDYGVLFLEDVNEAQEQAFEALAKAVIEKRPRIRTNPALVIN